VICANERVRARLKRWKARIGRLPERAAGRQGREEAMTQPDFESGRLGLSRRGGEVVGSVIRSRHEADDRFGADAVADAVANALHWDLALPRDRIVAHCDGGWVTLSGKVERAYQRSSAEADVLRVVGVRGVTNAITVAAAAPRAGVGG